MPRLEDVSIHAWIPQHGIKNEKGLPIDFDDHLFLFQPYADLSPRQVFLKAAQVGLSTLQILKSLYVAAKYSLNVIYTLPTDSDVQDFAGGKVNPIISQNPVLQEYVKDHDTVEQKRVGNSIIYYRGTFTQKAAIMVSSDVNVYDEVDASNQNVIEQYSSRLQHSKFKYEWYFSHPSTEGTGVDKFWQLSDQKHWFIICGACKFEQYLNWPESIDPIRKVYQCKDCGSEITNKMRRNGRWVAKYKDRPYSGYWIPLLICPWVPADEVLDKHANKSEEYFQNKVLGLPFVGGGNKLSKANLLKNLTDNVVMPENSERCVMGVDTGLKLDYVMGGTKGLFFNGEAQDYDELDAHMTRWTKMIAIVDAGGDLIGSRKFKERWPGRVFLCVTGGDKKGTDDPVWNDDERIVIADRNKMISMVVGEFNNQLIPLQGTELDWYEYALDWANLTRIRVVDPKTEEVKGYKWVRNGRDHKALATVYWRVGMTRFGGGKGQIINSIPGAFSNLKLSPELGPLGRIPATDPKKLYQYEKVESNEWRT